MRQVCPAADRRPSGRRRSTLRAPAPRSERSAWLRSIGPRLRDAELPVADGQIELAELGLGARVFTPPSVPGPGALLQFTDVLRPRHRSSSFAWRARLAASDLHQNWIRAPKTKPCQDPAGRLIGIRRIASAHIRFNKVARISDNFRIIKMRLGVEDGCSSIKSLFDAKTPATHFGTGQRCPRPRAGWCRD